MINSLLLYPFLATSIGEEVRYPFNNTPYFVNQSINPYTFDTNYQLNFLKSYHKTNVVVLAHTNWNNQFINIITRIINKAKAEFALQHSYKYANYLTRYTVVQR